MGWGELTPCRAATLTFCACYSSCGVRGSGTGCGTWTWTSRRTLMMRMRTCPETCHTTHSWSGRRSCGNVWSGTWGRRDTAQCQVFPVSSTTGLQRGKRPPSFPRYCQGSNDTTEMLLYLAPNTTVKWEQVCTRHSL